MSISEIFNLNLTVSAQLIVGFDSNKTYLETATKALKTLTPNNIFLNNADFLEAIDIKKQQASLFE